MTTPKIEVVGIVLAVNADDLNIEVPDDPMYDPCAACHARFEALGFEVQGVSLHIDGMFRVEVLSS